MKNIKALVLSAGFFGMGIFCTAQQTEFGIRYRLSGPYRVAKLVTTACGQVLQEKTFDEAGNLVRQEEWLKGKRCGTTKVYYQNKLLKEILFNDNLMVSYTGYINNVVYTQISANRGVIINKGRVVQMPWKRYYVKAAQGKIFVLTKSALVDAMRYFMVPEQITQSMEDLSKLAGVSPVPEGNAVLICGGKTKEIADANPSFGTADPSKRKAVEDLTADISNSCAAATASSLTEPFNSLTGNAARAGRIAAAGTAFDKMIETCSANGSNVSSGGLVSAEPVTTSGAVLAMQRLYTAAFDVALTSAERTAALAAADEMAIIIADAAVVTWSTTPITAGSGGGAILLGGFALPEILAGAAVVAAVVGTAIVVNEILDDGTSGTEPVTGGAAGESETGSTSGTGTSATGTPTTGGAGTPPDASMPIPGMDSENGCDRLKSFKKYCDNNGWNDMRCQDAARLLSGCKGDIREMMVSPEGDLSSVGCPSPMSPEDIARVKCKAQGMVARPEPGGSVCRNTGRIDGSIPNPANDPTIINPVRGDFSIGLASAYIKIANSAAHLVSLLQNTKRPTMVVFMNPDCGACQNFIGALKSKEVEAAAAAVDIIAIDASANSDVLLENQITAFPSYFVFKDGKKSIMTKGAMTALQTANYMNKLK
ncbi:MAG: thioredoxin domain-containing protein [Bacteroidota bacterium]